MFKTLTKKQVLAEFAEIWQDIIKHNPRARGDSIMKREEFNIYTDMLYKYRQITSKQYNNWTNPF